MEHWQGRLTDGSRAAQKRDSATGSDPPTAERLLPMFAPSIDMTVIFRELIADEVRTGRLTRARRRRIVQYAAQLGLSAVQVGRLIAECRRQATRSDDPAVRHHGLRLVDHRKAALPTPPSVSMPLKIAVLVAAAILLDVLVVKWLL